MKGIRVTVKDLETGKEESQEIVNDYILITAGNRYLAHTNAFGNGSRPQATVHSITRWQPSVRFSIVDRVVA